MVKLLGMPPQEVVDALKGSVDFYYWKGIAVARSWPRWPPREPTEAEKANQDLFGYAAGAWGRLPLIVKQAYNRQAANITYTGRDLFTVSFLNRIAFTFWYWGFPPPPKVQRHWFLTGYDHWWEGTDKHLRLTTDVTVHLWCAVSGDYPYNIERRVTWRGMSRRHGLDVIFHREFEVEQQEPGDTLIHNFIIRGWYPCCQRYWYFLGSFHENWQTSNTTWFTQHFTEPGPIPGPQTFVVPICWEVPSRRIRCGNHYTFWAGETWYAMVPTPDSLTMWKKVGMGMVRQDQAGEPLSTLGDFTDGDARVESTGNVIHCAAFENVAAPGPQRVIYAPYDVATDTWGSVETVASPVSSFFAVCYCSLSLDYDNVPHVVFNDYPAMFPEFQYSNRIGGVWSPPEVALKPPFNVAENCSIWHDPFDDALHVICNTNVSRLWYNRRVPAPPAWDGQLNVGASTNLPMHSVCANSHNPHIAGIPIDWRIDHWEGQPPIFWNQDLTLAVSNYANVLERLLDPGYLQIQFRDDDTNLAYIWRTPGNPWQPQVQQLPTDIIVLACNYSHPDVISGIWTKPGLFDVCIWAWYAHWAA